MYKIVKKKFEAADMIGYRIPEAYDREGAVNEKKRFDVSLDDYRESGGDKRSVFSEQEAWEEGQIRKATLRFGSKDQKQISDDYQFLFEDQTDFIHETRIEGDGLKDEPFSESRANEGFQYERTTLPIYPFGDGLLKAVHDHQILIIVGETGSGKTTQIPQYLQEAGYTKHGKIGSPIHAESLP